MAKTDPLIVCIDDDAALLATVVRTLRRPNLQILSTLDPQQALDWISTRDVAVIVSDYEMPQMTGVELLAAARRIRNEAVRVLLTGRKELDTAVEGINQGEVYRYVRKPFEPDRLCAVVDEALARHRELVAGAADREQAIRRERIHAELELEYPGITKVEREHDGAYMIRPPSAAAVSGLGLDAVILLGRP